MKIKIEPIGLEEVKEAISQEEIIELIGHGCYLYDDGEFKEDAIRALNMDSSDHLDKISDSYMNSYIKDNLGYYDITSEMQNKIARLEAA